MSRYNFTLTNDYECAVYMESTPEEDRFDIGIGALDGYGYLKFWKRCREATDTSGLFGTATILDTDYDEEKVWHIDPPKGNYTIRYSVKDVMDSLHTSVNMKTVNAIAIHLNQEFHRHMKEWAMERYHELMVQAALDNLKKQDDED